MKKRLLTWVLCITMVCSLVPATVLAARADQLANATPITVGKSVSYSIEANESQYFSFRNTKAGQFASVSFSSSNTYTRSSLYDSSGANCGSFLSTVGTYYIGISNYRGADSGTFTLTLHDNDSHEPNNTQETATPLRSGGSADIKLDSGDEDWFCIQTAKDAQDVRVDVSGFAHDNQGRIDVLFDGFEINDETIGVDNQNISRNCSLYFHASKAGKHYITLSGYSYNDNGVPLSLTVKATVLDGDGNESNDTQATATALALGTDKTFSLGGIGDEDWFRFDVLPEAEGNDLYTLRFLDLNPDYSDELRYTVISPSGKTVVAETTVSIAHSVIFSCTEQGAYYVLVSADVYYSGIPITPHITRSDLRIRISKGGSDPHESNDTWLTAAPLQVGQLTQHVLSSTADEDWFWFTAPEADMGFQFTTDRSTKAYLYRASDLAESGASASPINGDRRSSRYPSASCKLDEAGVYYLELVTESSYATDELRSFTVTLTAPGSEEHNDTWDRATPLFESVPQSFDLFGENDTDWFKITVPEGMTALHIALSNSYSGEYRINSALYAEKDIISAGLNTSPILSFDYENHYSSTPKNSINSIPVTAGTYYLRLSQYLRYGDEVSLLTNFTVTYSLSEIGGTSINEALTLVQNEWSAPFAGDTYIALGELQAGDVVRLDRDSFGYNPSVSLRDSNDNSNGYRDNAHAAFTISTDGTYYLYIPGISGTDSNGEFYHSRIRYCVCHPTDAPATALEEPDEITLYVGQKQYIDLTLSGYSSRNYDLDRNSNSSVASYNNSTGYVTANAEGSATLTFTCRVNSETTLTKTVTVNVLAVPEATGLAISGAPESLSLGGKAYLTAELTPEGAAADVSWSSSDSSVLYVLPGGKVVAVGEGSATVTATAGGLSDAVTIAVTPAAPPVNELRSLTLDAYSLTLYMGEESQKLTAATQPADIDTRITWTTSNAGVATVDQSGNISAVAPGVSIISASAGDHSVSCVVTVQAARVRVTGISFAMEELSIPLGGESLLNPTITPYNATTKSLTWVSDDPRIASVSRTGTVNALAVGETTIRATTLDGGKVAEITIIVTTSPQLGDVNGDGYIDAGDAMLCMRSAVELVELTAQQRAAADVNGDHSVDAGDAVKILRYNAGLIETLQ